MLKEGQSITPRESMIVDRLSQLDLALNLADNALTPEIQLISKGLALGAKTELEQEGLIFDAKEVMKKHGK